MNRDRKFGLSRRNFLKSGASLAAMPVLASSLLGNRAAAETSRSKHFFEWPENQRSSFGTLDVDFAVVGAGFAGITAANRLVTEGYRVAVLEARDRIGGRTHTKEYLGAIPLDAGGQWIGPGQDYILRMANHFQVPLFETYNSGWSLVETERRRRGSVIHRYKAEAGITDSAALRIFKTTVFDFGTLYDGLDRLAQSVDLASPWNTPNASALDAMTLESWMDQAHVHLGPLRLKPVAARVKTLFRSVIQSVFTADPSRLSFLHTLFYIKSGGGLDSLTGVAGGAQQTRFRNGTGELLHKLCESFRDSIHLNAPVRLIRQTASGVEVISDRGLVRARRAIVALPPTLAGRIEYQPGLSADRDQLTQNIPMGSTIKCTAIYDRPFWRNDSDSEYGGPLSGQFFSPYLPVTMSFDNSHPDSEFGVMLGFLVGPQAELYRRVSAEERRTAVLESFAHFFGSKALQPLHYEDTDWSQEVWSRGAYAGYFPPSIWTSLGESLTRPEGRIHWAGTETSPEWNGYIEGAIRSGYRVAREVITSES